MRKKNILKYWFVTVLAIALLASSAIATDDVLINVSIKPAATWPMSELAQVVTGGRALDQIGYMTLTNTTDKDQKLKLRIKLYSNKIGINTPLVDYTTSYSNYPIDIPANSSLTIDTRDEGMATGGTLRSSYSEVRSKVEAAYGANPLGYSGWIPEDTYKYVIIAFDKDDNEQFENDKLGYTSETMFIPMHSNSLTIREPASNEMTMQIPIFSWDPLEARDGAEVKYKLNLFKVESEDDTNESNLEFTSQTDSTQVQYSGSRELVNGQYYKVSIEAYDEPGGYLAGAEKIFRYGFAEPPSIINDDQEVDTLPITLAWTTMDLDSSFRVVVTEDQDGQMVVLDTTVSNTTSYVIDDSQLINPGKKYYWFVELILDGSDSKIRSAELGSFILNQRLELISPNDNEVIQDPNMITFYWDGNTNSQYVLKISFSETMDLIKRYVVDGTKQDIMLKDLQLERDMVHYWTVREIDGFGNEWGIEPQPGTFKLPELDQPKIISPKKNEIVSDKVIFSFNLLSWADYYRIDIFSKANERIFSEEVTAGHLKVNLAEITDMVSGRKYAWTVTAISDEWNESHVSNYGKFKYESKVERDLSEETRRIELINQPEFLTPTTVISWTPIEEDGIFYEIHISEGPSFKNPKIIPMTESSYEFKSIDKFDKDIFYIIFAFNEDKNLITKSKVFKISISDVDVLHEPIILVEPQNNVIQDMKWKFSWLPELKDATLSIATHKSFKDKVEFIVSGETINFEDIKYDFKVGVNYFWKLERENHPSDMIYNFKIVPSEIMLVQPLNVKTELNDVIFQWIANADMTYKVLLSKDKQFKDIIDTVQTESLMVKYLLKEYGEIFWKVQQLDSDGNLIQESDIGYIDYSKPNSIISSDTRKNLEYFIKQNLDNNSKIKVEEWRLTEVNTVGRTKVTEDDIQYLLDNKSQLIRIVE